SLAIAPRSALLEPRPGGVGLGSVEVTDGGAGESPGQADHPPLPRMLTDVGDPLDAGAVRRVKLHVVPEAWQVPAVEVVQLDQEPDLALAGHRGVEEREQRREVLAAELAGHPDVEDVVGRPGELLQHGSSSLETLSCRPAEHQQADGADPAAGHANRD